MKLLSMKLENFQGIRFLDLEFPDGCSGSIYGDNGTGKTTVFNALTWLLFDKASTGAKDFSPKTRGADGEGVHHLNHGVTASFRQESGEVVSFQKVYHEVYKKKRGSAQEERDGHTVDYFVNGVPTKEKDYTATILSLCGGDAEKPKMLTMPDYFAEQLPWKTRRTILLDVCGSVSDQEVINSSAELRELPAYLAIPGTSGRMYGIDEYRKITSARLKSLNEQISAVPGRIDEAEKAIPDLAGMNEEAVNSSIRLTSEELASLQLQRANAASDDAHGAEIRKQIADTELRISESRLAYLQQCNRELSEKNSKAMEAEKNVSIHRIAKMDLEAELRRAREKLAAVSAKRDEIMKAWRRVNAETLSESVKICPTCGRELPEDKLEKIVSDFNLSKSRRLAELNRKGKTEASKGMIADLNSEIQELEQKVTMESAAVDEAVKASAEAKRLAVSPEPYESTEEYAGYQEQLAALRNQLENSTRSASETVALLDAQIASVRERERSYTDLKVKFSIAATQKARICELETEERRLSEEYSVTEHGLYLCEVFTRTKVDMLTEKINQKFKRVRFRLFETQQNGGLKEGCDVMVPTDAGNLVPYADSNNAARINAGLEIINTLSDHWGVKLPVMVDNAESITRLEPIDTQVIRLVVSEPDKSLRLKVEGK